MNWFSDVERGGYQKDLQWVGQFMRCKGLMDYGPGVGSDFPAKMAVYALVRFSSLQKHLDLFLFLLRKELYYTSFFKTGDKSNHATSSARHTVCGGALSNRKDLVNFGVSEGEVGIFCTLFNQIAVFSNLLMFHI